MICHACGKETEESHKFCSHCGAEQNPDMIPSSESSFDFQTFLQKNKLYVGTGLLILIVLIVALLAGKGEEKKPTQKQASAQPPQQKTKEIAIELNPGVPISGWTNEVIKKIYTDQYNEAINTFLKDENEKNKKYAALQISRCFTEMLLKEYPKLDSFNAALNNPDTKEAAMKNVGGLREGCIKGFVNTHQKDAQGNLILKPRREQPQK